MPALAGDGWLAANTFAIIAAVFSSLLYRAVATWMGTLLVFLFSHDGLLPLSNTTNDGMQWPMVWCDPSQRGSRILVSADGMVGSIIAEDKRVLSARGYQRTFMRFAKVSPA
jgi:hypothetical protein